MNNYLSNINKLNDKLSKLDINKEELEEILILINSQYKLLTMQETKKTIKLISDNDVFIVKLIEGI